MHTPLSLESEITCCHPQTQIPALPLSPLIMPPLLPCPVCPFRRGAAPWDPLARPPWVRQDAAGQCRGRGARGGLPTHLGTGDRQRHVRGVRAEGTCTENRDGWTLSLSMMRTRHVMPGWSGLHLAVASRIPIPVLTPSGCGGVSRCVTCSRRRSRVPRPSCSSMRWTPSRRRGTRHNEVLPLIPHHRQRH